MPTNIKTFIFIAGVGGLVLLWLYQSKVLPVGRGQIRRWALIWLWVTAAGALAPNFWLFIAVVAPACIVVTTGSDERKVALYFLLLPAMPLIASEVPAFGLVNYLFTLNYGRLLAVVLLLPVVVSTVFLRRRRGPLTLRTDKYVLAYGLVVFALAFRATSVTDAFRTLFDFVLDIGLPYLAVSRALLARDDFINVLSAVAVSGATSAGLATFEAVKHWRMYQTLGGGISMNRYLSGFDFRAGFLRASTTFRSPILLGYFETICLAAVSGLKLHIKSTRSFWILAGMMSLAIVLTFARGAWVGAAAFVLTYTYLSKNRLRSFVIWAAGGSIALLLLSMTPVGQKIIDFLPFFGSERQDTITYRQDLLTNGLQIVAQSPFFGSPNFLQTDEMEQLRQGQGIIDIVNSFLGVALQFGLAGLIPFVLVQVSALSQLWRTMKRSKQLDAGWFQIHRGLFAAIVGIMVILFTVSSIDRALQYYWAFAGLASAACYAFRREYAKARTTEKKMAVGMTPRRQNA